MRLLFLWKTTLLCLLPRCSVWTVFTSLSFLSTDSGAAVTSWMIRVSALDALFLSGSSISLLACEFVRRPESPYHLGVLLSSVASDALGESAISPAPSNFVAFTLTVFSCQSEPSSPFSSRAGAARYAGLRFSFGGDGIMNSTCISTMRGAFCNSVLFYYVGL